MQRIVTTSQYTLIHKATLSYSTLNHALVNARISVSLRIQRSRRPANMGSIPYASLSGRSTSGAAYIAQAAEPDRARLAAARRPIPRCLNGSRALTFVHVISSTSCPILVTASLPRRAALQPRQRHHQSLGLLLCSPRRRGDTLWVPRRRSV